MKIVRRAGRQWVSPSSDDNGSGVQLKEWEKEGWTYHAKGVWHPHFAFPHDLDHSPGIWLRPTPTSNPSLTLFGSTNLNPRSANLDVKLSFVMITTSDDLRQRMGEEVAQLRQYTFDWRGAGLYVGWITWILLVLSMYINAL